MQGKQNIIPLTFYYRYIIYIIFVIAKYDSSFMTYYLKTIWQFSVNVMVTMFLLFKNVKFNLKLVIFFAYRMIIEK